MECQCQSRVERKYIPIEPWHLLPEKNDFADSAKFTHLIQSSALPRQVGAVLLISDR